jgi:mannose-6-phosphate isomerase
VLCHIVVIFDLFQLLFKKMKNRIFKLQGKVQHYAWGGYDFIPALLGIYNYEHKPYAEYWMGAHSGAPGLIQTGEGLQSWKNLIDQSPVEYLGKQVHERFGELPYLFKVLDVNEMLSIQVHPTKEEAKKGFEREELAGIPIHASNRSYKDKNHKPEVMIALGDFWLLHGFKKEDELERTLNAVSEFTALAKVFSREGYYGLYKTVMEMPQEEVDKLLLPLLRREINSEYSKDEPGFWASKLYKGTLPAGNVDKGIFSIYFFNIVRLRTGEGIFQGAGVPHAYLEGQNVELMANSDNVLRGGLTSKHIDVPELLKHIVFEGIEPMILTGEISGHELRYSVPAEDFGITAIKLTRGDNFVSQTCSAETILVMEGEVICGHLRCKKGEVFVVLPGTHYAVRCIENATLYRAFVPVI